jgi:diguanylate cyclase (GGDEF)-like protein/PAS domain S-box-containing protein
MHSTEELARRGRDHGVASRPGPISGQPDAAPAFDLVGALPAVVWMADGPGGQATFVSARAREIIGFEPEAWMGAPGFWADHVHPDDIGEAWAAAEEAILSGGAKPVQYRFLTADGSYRWFQDSIQVITFAGAPRLVGVMVDVNVEHTHMEALVAARARTATGASSDPVLSSPLHKSIVDNLSDGVYYIDRERRINYWNHGAERLTGYSAADVIGRFCYDNILSHVDAEGRSLCHTACPLLKTMNDGRERQAILWLRHSNGHRLPVQVRTTPIHEDGPVKVVGGVQTFSDATGLVEAREEASRARRDALTDPLTGLPNRRLLDAVLASRHDELERHQVPFGFLMIDVDHFKLFNDEHGHDVGDRALRTVAATLKGGLRAGDTLVRWGGEEFAVVASHVTDDGIVRLADRLLLLIRATRVQTTGGGVPIRVSLGGALALPGEPLEQLFVRADRALLAAKATGRDRFVLDGMGPTPDHVVTARTGAVTPARDTGDAGRPTPR